jgi:hypothetical protein
MAKREQEAAATEKAAKDLMAKVKADAADAADAAGSRSNYQQCCTADTMQI